MRKRKLTPPRSILVALLPLLLWAPMNGNALVDPPTLAIGSPAPDFNLPGVDGKNYKLSDFSEALGDNALEAFISRLRKKLAGSGARIRTLRGLGYALERDTEDAA